MLLNLAHQNALARRRADPGRLLVGCGRRPDDRDRVIDLGKAVGEDGLNHDALDLLDSPDVALGGISVAGVLA
jgi:hypothetical protein